MQTVRQDDRQATYALDEETGQLTATRFETAGRPIAETTREFDDLGRLTSIETRSLTEDGNFHQSFDYTYNHANQRTRVGMADGGYWNYDYDELGQLVSAKKYWRDGTPVAGQQFEYSFDGIGNRESARYGGDAKGENLSEITYTTGGRAGESDPTQIGAIDHPGVTYVTGSANEEATVTAKEQWGSLPKQWKCTSFGSKVRIAVIMARRPHQNHRDHPSTVRHSP